MTIATSPRTDVTPPTLPGWMELLTAPLLIRAFVVALILGSLLSAINQPGALFSAATIDLLPLVLVYVTPFAVVALSQLLGVRQALRDRKPLPSSETFIATVVAHGIPKKAILTGLLAGTINTSITAAATLIDTGSLSGLPVPLIAQAFALPVLFGLLSQTISYRRAAARFAAPAAP